MVAAMPPAAMGVALTLAARRTCKAVRGDHRWAVRAAARAGPGRGRAGRADRLLHHRRPPGCWRSCTSSSASSSACWSCCTSASQLGAELNPDGGAAASTSGRVVQIAGVDAAVAGLRGPAPAGTSTVLLVDPQRRGGLGGLRRAALRRRASRRSPPRPSAAGLVGPVRAVAVPLPVRVGAAVHHGGDRAAAARLARRTSGCSPSRRDTWTRACSHLTEAGGTGPGHRHRGEPRAASSRGCSSRAPAWRRRCRAAARRSAPAASDPLRRRSEQGAPPQLRDAPCVLPMSPGRTLRCRRRSVPVLQWPPWRLQALVGRLDLGLGLGAADPVRRPRRTCRAPGPCRPRRSAGSPGGRTPTRGGCRAGAPPAGRTPGTHSSLSSPPASSVIRNMPIARHLMRQPGKVGSSRMTSASSGSPSSPRVFSTKP